MTDPQSVEDFEREMTKRETRILNALKAKFDGIIEDLEMNEGKHVFDEL